MCLLWISCTLTLYKIVIEVKIGYRENDFNVSLFFVFQLSQDLGYVMYSAFGSFYIPSCIMVFVYIKIYYAARERARRVINKPGLAKRVSRRFTGKSSNANPATNNAAAVVAANKKGLYNIFSLNTRYVCTVLAWIQPQNFIFHSGCLGEPLFQFDLPRQSP